MGKKVLFVVNLSRDSETSRLESIYVCVCTYVCTPEVSAIQMLLREDWERADFSDIFILVT